MGMFDTYGESQLKAGECKLHDYKVGDKVPIKDGIYPGSSNFVVVKNGIFIAELANYYDYYGENPQTAGESRP